MILNVRRASGFPILMEENELQTLEYLEEYGLYTELEDYEKQLRRSDSLKDIKIEVKKLDEILIFINSLNHVGSITINFHKNVVVINDAGADVSC